MITFRKLLTDSMGASEKHSSSLDDWFFSIIDLPISKFSVEDISRAVRQKLFLDAVLPCAYDVLRNDPLAGEYYDGELIAAIASLSSADIQRNIKIINEIRGVLNSINPKDLTKELQKDILKITTDDS